jgi:triacylglycerol lipase
MAFEKKPLPRPSLRLVVNPESDTDYRHFEGALDSPFDTTPTLFSRVNAWWLADSALLSYWNSDRASDIFRNQAGLESAPVQNNGTQGYVAWNQAFALVAFRGTEPDSALDILTNANIPFKPWDVSGERVHSGFMDALDDVWAQVVATLTPLIDRPVWFTGHSLGAALATLAGDRFLRERDRHGFGELGGIYTFGSPLVGNRQFVDGFNSRCGDRSFRFVNNRDTVTRVPPSLIGYRHVNNERFVGFDDRDVSFSEPLIDHTPRRYAVLVWNSLIDSLEGTGRAHL